MSLLDQWPRDLLSLADWEALPEDTSRHFELVDGVIAVNARPTPRHQRVSRRLATVLERALAPRWGAEIEIELVIDGGTPATVRAPDVVVAREGAVDDRPRLLPGDVLAVVEVLSPGTRRTDRIAKVADYAEAGIECYLLVEPGPPTVLTELRLRDGAYEQVAEHTGTAGITLDGIDVAIDLAGMLEP